MKRRGRLAGPVTPACAPGSHPGSPTRDKASGGLPGPPRGLGGHEAGCPQGCRGPGSPNEEAIGLCRHSWCVAGRGSAHPRRYACDTRERCVGQTHSGEAHALHGQRGGGWRACRGRPCARHVWVKLCAHKRRERAECEGPGVRRGSGVGVRRSRRAWAARGGGTRGGGERCQPTRARFPPGKGAGGGTRRGSAAEEEPGAPGRGPGSACTHRAALRSPGRRRVHPSVRSAVGASRARGARRRRGAGRGRAGGRAERAPGPRAALPPPPPGRGLGRGRGGGRARAAAPRPAAPPGPDVAAPRVRLEPRAPWARPLAGPSRRGVPTLALQPSGAVGPAASASWASVSPPGRWAGLPERVERARGAWPPLTSSLPVLGSPTPPLACWHRVPAPSLGLSFSPAHTAACGHCVTSAKALDLSEPRLLIS